MDDVDPFQVQPLLLSEQLNDMRYNEDLCDVRLLVGKSKDAIFAHRLVLAAESDVFRAMVYPPSSSTKHKARVTVEIPDFTKEAVDVMVECLYTDQLNISTDQLKEVIALGKKFRLRKMQHLVQNYLKLGVDKSNAMELFETGPELIGNPKLGLPWIRDNTEDALKSPGFLTLSPSRLRYLLGDNFLSIEEVELFKAVLKWGKKQVKKREGVTLREVLEAVLPEMRFPLMEPAQFADVVMPAALLKTNEALSVFRKLAVMGNEEERDTVPCLFPSKEREGALSIKGYKTDILKDKMVVKKLMWAMSDDAKKPVKSAKLMCLYSMKRDGTGGSIWRQKCGSLKGTLVVIETTNGRIFGGYNAGVWTAQSSYRNYEGCYVFSLHKPKDRKAPPLKYVPGNNNHVYPNGSYGPTFGGGHDIYICAQMTTNSNYNSSSTYQRPAKNFPTTTPTSGTLAGAYNFTVKAMEIFHVVKLSQPK